jgi:hypothetical protein
MGGAHIGDGYESIGWPSVAYSGLFLAYSAASWADDLPTSVLVSPTMTPMTEVLVEQAALAWLEVLCSRRHWRIAPLA